MRRSLTAFMLAFALVVTFAAPAGSQEPLRGEMELDFYGVPCDDGSLYAWNGTITFGDDVYAMAFFNLGSGKPFAVNPSESVGFFGEIWAIYDGPFPSDCAWETDNLIMWGTDTGVGTFNNLKYRMNGEVAFATGDFDGWEGRKVHMAGTFTFGSAGPETAPGTFRAN